MKNKQILFIDDELSWSNFAKKILTESGYNVQIKENIEDGLNLLQKKQFQIVFVDFKKVERQEKVFQKMATLQIKAKSSIIVMSPTELTPKKIVRIFNLGAQDCVDKPYERSRLIALVEETFSKRFLKKLTLEKKSDKNIPFILIVEDDKDWQERLTYYLKSQPYRLEVAGKYSDALNLLKTRHFDLIILDLRLVDNKEDFEGMKLLEYLQKNNPQILVIIVSAHGTPQHIRDGYTIYNIFDYISKQNFDRKKYQETVKKAIHKLHVRY